MPIHTPQIRKELRPHPQKSAVKLCVRVGIGIHSPFHLIILTFHAFIRIPSPKPTLSIYHDTTCNMGSHHHSTYFGEWAIALHGRVPIHQDNWFSTHRENKIAKALYTQPAVRGPDKTAASTTTPKGKYTESLTFSTPNCIYANYGKLGKPSLHVPSSLFWLFLFTVNIFL